MHIPPRRQPQLDRPGRRLRQADAVLLRVVDGALAGCILLVPFLMGGRQALGQFVLVALSAAAAAAWLLREGVRRQARWRYSAAELLLLGAVLLVVAQLLPHSPTLLESISPKTAELLPLWNGTADGSPSLGVWTTISLTPGETRAGLAVFLAYAMLFFVTVQRVASLEDVERLLRWTAVAAVSMAAFGLVQFLTSNDKFFWFYEHPYSRTSDVAKGAFTNRNHFAHFLALGLGPLVWWLQHKRGPSARRRRRSFDSQPRRPSSAESMVGLKLVGLGVLLFAGLLSLSRGGAVVMLLAAIVSVAACYRAKTLGPRFILSLGGVAVLIGVLLSIYGYERVSGRLDTLRSGSIEAVDSVSGRWTIWATVFRAAGDFALFGSGVGSHREVYPMYLKNPPEREYTHAENGPLQVLLETGAVGLTLAAAGVALCGFWCTLGLWRAPSPRMLAAVGAVAAGLAANVVHSLADFVWYVPGCMAIVAVLAGCACRLCQLGSEPSGETRLSIALPRYAAWAALPAVVAVGGWMIQNRFGPTLAQRHWDRYRIVALAAARVNPTSQSDPAAESGSEPGTKAADPADPTAEVHEDFAENIEGASLRAVTSLIADLERIVAHHPDHARAQLRLAAAYLRRFELKQLESDNAMPLSQIRDAALAARQHGSTEQVAAWLDRVLGERRRDLDLAAEHARRALALCPLQGEAYLFLAEICFLDANVDPATAKKQYLAQALNVRPYDGAVLFEIGREAWLAGNLERGLEFWQKAFAVGRRYQKQLIHLLCGRVPLEFFVETFEPDLAAMRLVHERCRELGDPNLLGQARQFHGEAAVAAARLLEGPEAAETYLEACWVAGRLGDRELAVACAREAYKQDPNNYNVREALAKSLVAADRAAEAEEHLQWCLARRPNSKRLEELSKQYVRRRIDRQARIDRQVKPATYEKPVGWDKRSAGPP